MEETKYFFIIILNSKKRYKNVNCLGTFNDHYIKKQGVEYIKNKITDYDNYEFIKEIIIVSKINKYKYNELKNNNKLKIDYEIDCLENYELSLDELSDLVDEYRPEGNPFISKDYDKFLEYSRKYIYKYLDETHKELFEDDYMGASYSYDYEDDYDQYEFISTQTFDFYCENIIINCETINYIYDDGIDSRHINNKSQKIKITDDNGNNIERDNLDDKIKNLLDSVENTMFYLID